MREEAMLTVLPHGTAEDGRLLRASIFVTPRLEATSGRGTLGDFPLFARWAEVIAASCEAGEIALHFDGGPVLRVEPDPDPPARRPEQELWDLLLPPSTPVSSRRMVDLADRRWRTFPVDDVLADIADLYAEVAAGTPSDFPDGSKLDRRMGRLSVLRHRQELEGMLEQHFGAVGDHGGTVIDRSSIHGSERTTLAFAQARRFYDRPGTRIGRDDAVPERPKPVELDFHDACTALADHPELLRRLGLVLDVRVPADVPGNGMVRVAELDRLGAVAGPAMRPWTRYDWRDGRFRAEEKAGGDHEDGMLHLNRERHVVTDMDVDGSAGKLGDFAATVAELVRQATALDPKGVSLPALRNGGVTVARRDRAAALAAHVGEVRDREASTLQGSPAVLWADDLVRGYRVDVRDDRTARWWSLCRRVGRYLVDRDGGGELDVEPDEGYVKISNATSTPEGIGDDDLYLHEAVFGWDGWSLVAPRPGIVTPTHAGDPVEPAPDPGNPCALATQFRPQDGSLPVLRFGRTYEVRARAVDLSGTSWGLDDGDVPEGAATPPHTYRRWEPVPAPALLPRRPFNEGESVRRLVIRSTVGETPRSYVRLDRIERLRGHERTSGADGLDRSYVDEDHRHVLPPKTGLQLVELHGELDPALGAKPQAVRDDVLALATREAGTIYDLPGVRVVNRKEAPTDLGRRDRGEHLAQGETVVVDRDAIELPYLADVLARGAAVSGLPGQPRVLKVPFGAFPDQLPFRLDLIGTEADAESRWHADDRVLRIALPPAEMLRIGVSCHLHRDDLELLAVWNLLSNDDQRRLEEMAADGQHWMLTPKVELTLVHAVERPMAEPVVGSSLQRRPGETFVSLTGTVAVHSHSTGRIDIGARWTEPVDDPLLPAPTEKAGQAHVADLDVEYDEPDVQLGRDEGDRVHRARHELGDTKHRFVSYDALATTRYREYFPGEITDRPALVTLQGPATAVHVPSSRRPEPPEVLYVVPTFTWENGRRGVRRTRKGGGLRIYLARPWYSSGADEHLAVVLPDQAPPITFPSVFDDGWIRDAVKRLGVRDVTPKKLAAALEAASRDAVATTTPARTRSAVPSLGFESLHVDAAAFAPFIAGDATPHVTWWGSDPVWASDRLPTVAPRIQSFTNCDRWDTGVSLAEVPGTTVAVAAYVPKFDEERRLWFVDVDVDAGTAYFPFVRLALARYQPYSVPGAHLSGVVTGEWAQIPADRTVSMRTLRGGVTVTVEGVATYNDAGERLGRSVADSHLVVAQVERVRGAGDLGWERVGEQTVLRLAAQDGAVARWQGRVALPDEQKGWRYRIAVEEHELYETDRSQAQYWETSLANATGTMDLGALGSVAFPTFALTPLRSRLVYADHFTLAAGRGAGGLVPVYGERFGRG